MNKTSKMKWVKLRDTFEELIDYRGLTPKKLKGEWSDKGIRALSALHVKTTGLTNLENIRFVSPELYKRWMRKEVQKGDILLTSEAPAGQVMVWDTDEKIVLSQRLYGIRVNTRYNNYYIKYYLQSEIGQQEIKRNSSGSTVFGISARMFDRIKVPYKKLENQIAIGKTLKALDEKIKVNNKINQELEAMAKTLYDYWFVQFDFPAYLSGTLSGVEGYKSSGGKMVYNEELKREIPEGWEDKRFGDYGTVSSGFAFKSSSWVESGLPVVKIKDITEEGEIDLSNLAYVNSVDATKAIRFKASPGDLVIAMTGATVGKFAIIPYTEKNIYINQRVGLYDLGEKPLEKTPFIYCSLKQDYFREQVFLIASGAAQPNISGEQLDNIQMIMPPKKLIDKFNKDYYSTFKKILLNQYENQKLVELRDWLLPMLMNGQVTVGEGYAAQEEVLGMVAEEGATYGKEQNKR